MYNFQHCVVSSDWRIPTAIMPDGGVPTAAWATAVTQFSTLCRILRLEDSYSYNAGRRRPYSSLGYGGHSIFNTVSYPQIGGFLQL